MLLNQALKSSDATDYMGAPFKQRSTGIDNPKKQTNGYTENIIEKPNYEGAMHKRRRLGCNLLLMRRKADGKPDTPVRQWALRKEIG